MNERNYAPGNWGHPASSFPLSEFEITVLDPGIPVGSSESMRVSPGPFENYDLLCSVRSAATWGETFRAAYGNQQRSAVRVEGVGFKPGDVPQAGADSKLSYDFSDPVYIPGGGPFGLGGFQVVGTPRSVLTTSKWSRLNWFPVFARPPLLFLQSQENYPSLLERSLVHLHC